MGGRGSRSGGTSASGGASASGGQGTATQAAGASNGFTGAVDGKDISDTWVPPTFSANASYGQIATEIETVMDVQGFRGKPRVITDDDEFEKAAAAAWGGAGMVMVRGVGAPDDQTLKAYSDSLTNGEWYVSCSGGAAYGHGQYAAFHKGVSNATQNDIHVAETYASYYGPSRKAFVMTLDPSAKIGEHYRLERQMLRHNRDAIASSGRVQALIRQMEKNKDSLKAYERSALNRIKKGDFMLRPLQGYASPNEYNEVVTKFKNALIKDGRSGYSDVGVYAASKGYDFYYTGNYGVVLNRTKLIVKG